MMYRVCLYANDGSPDGEREITAVNALAAATTVAERFGARVRVEALSVPAELLVWAVEDRPPGGEWFRLFEPDGDESARSSIGISLYVEEVGISSR